MRESAFHRWLERMRAGPNVPGAISELGAPQEIDAATHSRISGRDFAAFHQSVERLAGSVRVTLESCQLAPTAVRPLQSDQFLRELLQNTGLLSGPSKAKQFVNAFFVRLRVGVGQPRPGLFNARLQLLAARRDRKRFEGVNCRSGRGDVTGLDGGPRQIPTPMAVWMLYRGQLVNHRVGGITCQVVFQLQIQSDVTIKDGRLGMKGGLIINLEDVVTVVAQLEVIGQEAPNHEFSLVARHHSVGLEMA